MPIGQFPAPPAGGATAPPLSNWTALGSLGAAITVLGDSTLQPWTALGNIGSEATLAG